MELADYFIRIWHRKWLVASIAIIIVLLDLMVLYLLPRQYKSTTVVEVGGIQSFLGVPGQVRESSRQSLPSAVLAETQSYLMLLNTPEVSDNAKKIVQVQPGNAGQVISFAYYARAEAVRGASTDVIYINANSDNPVTAQQAADALASELVRQGRENDSEVANSFAENLQSEQIDPINKRLAEIRDEIEQLRASTNLNPISKNSRMASLEDEIKTFEDIRKQYTDAIARVRLNETLDKSYISIVSEATLPSSKEAPALLRNGVIAAIMGLLLGVMTVVIIDSRKGVKLKPKVVYQYDF